MSAWRSVCLKVVPFFGGKLKNVNYNLIKLLHSVSDIVWRIEKYYLRDAEAANCHSVAALKSILLNEKNHAAMLRNEIKMRLEAGVFD